MFKSRQELTAGVGDLPRAGEPYVFRKRWAGDQGTAADARRSGKAADALYASGSMEDEVKGISPQWLRSAAQCPGWGQFLLPSKPVALATRPNFVYAHKARGSPPTPRRFHR